MCNDEKALFMIYMNALADEYNSAEDKEYIDRVVLDMFHTYAGLIEVSRCSTVRKRRRK